eukprot:gi/632991042/ref/XP_007884447.1/ PREDICTED: uncharacterized protein LOC103173673 [Callorhinchus milii]
MAKWLTAAARENWVPSPRATLCSNHFTTDCFEKRNNRRHLKLCSVPTIFPPAANKAAGDRRVHKLNTSSADNRHREGMSALQSSPSPSEAVSACDALSQTAQSVRTADKLTPRTTEALDTGRLAQLAAAAAVLNPKELPQISEVPFTPCLFTTPLDPTSAVIMSEGTGWIYTEVLIPESQTHQSTAPLCSSEGVQLSSETALSPNDLPETVFPQDHSYFMSPYPDIIRQTLERKLAWEKKKNKEQRQKFRVLQQKLKRKNQKIDQLNKIINQLRKNIKTDEQTGIAQ